VEVQVTVPETASVPLDVNVPELSVKAAVVKLAELPVNVPALWE
jgi:hypothetical protein